MALSYVQVMGLMAGRLRGERGGPMRSAQSGDGNVGAIISDQGDYGNDHSGSL
jgi:hypothetical protein